MSPIFIVLFIALVVPSDVINAQSERPRPGCGRNTIWSFCASPCQTSCEGLKNNNTRMCPAVCVMGCRCLPGYIRINDTNPDCMLQRDCPNSPRVEPIRDCGPNAVWSRCRQPCPRSCDNLNNPDLVRCFEFICRPGCNCVEGYIKKSENSPECVLERNCPR